MATKTKAPRTIEDAMDWFFNVPPLTWVNGPKEITFFWRVWAGEGNPPPNKGYAYGNVVSQGDLQRMRDWLVEHGYIAETTKAMWMGVKDGRLVIWAVKNV